MFTVKQIHILAAALASQEAIVMRRIRAETSSEIKAVLETQITDIMELQVAINNPKLLVK